MSKFSMKVFLSLIVAACGLRVQQRSDEQMMQCSMNDFKQTELKLVKDGLLNNSYNADAEYDKINAACTSSERVPVLSDRPLIANVGMGTMGSRWVDRVMVTLGFKTAHNWHAKPTDYASSKIEYISDSPVPYQAYEIFQGYPDAIFFMAMRDGKDWQNSRLRHRNGHAQNFTTFGLCGIKGNLDDADAATYLAAREIWLSCTLPHEKLFQYNLFNTDGRTFLSQLKTFLEKHGQQKPHWEKKFSTLMSMSKSFTERPVVDFALDGDDGHLTDQKVWWAMLDELDERSVDSELDEGSKGSENYLEVEPFFILDENGGFIKLPGNFEKLS